MATRGYGYSYYQIAAARKMHDHITAVHENLQDNVTDASLSVDSIIADFAPPALGDVSQVLSWIGIAAYLIGGIAGVTSFIAPTSAAVSAGTYFLGGVVNTINHGVSEGSVSIDPGDELLDTLHSIFGACRDTLITYLDLATGDDGDYTILPQVGQISGYATWICEIKLSADYIELI